MPNLTEIWHDITYTDNFTLSAFISHSLVVFLSLYLSGLTILLTVRVLLLKTLNCFLINNHPYSSSIDPSQILKLTYLN
jgi:hypothetical protein